MEILAKILGGGTRVKVMRLFLLNKNSVFTSQDVVKKSRVNKDSLRKELNLLSGVDFIKKKNNGWTFNPNFKYIKEFEGLLISADTIDRDAIANVFKGLGRTKLLVLSGVFIKNKEARLDLLLVGDKIKKSKLEDAIAKLEAEIGSEISYAFFETKEFLYRLDMYDKLVRDVLDFPHQVLVAGKEFPSHVLKRR